MCEKRSLSIQDKLALQSWLKSGASLAYVESLNPNGLVGSTRFSPRAVRAFRLYWSWSAIRLHGEAGAWQERYEQRCGKAALAKRIARARNKVSQFFCV